MKFTDIIRYRLFLVIILFFQIYQFVQTASLSRRLTYTEEKLLIQREQMQIELENEKLKEQFKLKEPESSPEDDQEDHEESDAISL